MSIAADIVVNDGQATPVAHTFVPLGFDTDGKSFIWEEQDGSLPPILWRRIKARLARNDPTEPGRNAGDSKAKVIVSVLLPTGETLGTADNGIEPPPTLAYINRNNNEFSTSGRATVAERKDLQAFGSNILANAQIKAMIVDLLNVR